MTLVSKVSDGWERRGTIGVGTELAPVLSVDVQHEKQRHLKREMLDSEARQLF